MPTREAWSWLSGASEIPPEGPPSLPEADPPPRTPYQTPGNNCSQGPSGCDVCAAEYLVSVARWPRDDVSAMLRDPERAADWAHHCHDIGTCAGPGYCLACSREQEERHTRGECAGGNACPACARLSVAARARAREEQEATRRRAAESRHAAGTCGGFAVGCPFCPPPLPRPECRFREGPPSARFPYYVGVEVECGVDDPEPLRPLEACGKVALHDDGSIRLEGAVEVVTAPARGDAFRSLVRDVCATLAEANATVDRSCGLHVHVDARDMTDAQVLSLSALYSRLERALYDLVAPSRRQRGGFAEPWRAALRRGLANPAEGTVAERAARLDANVYGSVETARAVKRNRDKVGCRYHGLNLNALACHGTVEFRMHHGTVDARKILMWSAVCCAMMRFAREHGEAEVVGMHGPPSRILDRVLAGDRTVSAWVRERRAYFRDVRRAARGLPPLPRVESVRRVTESEEGETSTRGRRGRRAY